MKVLGILNTMVLCTVHYLRSVSNKNIILSTRHLWEMGIGSEHQVIHGATMCASQGNGNVFHLHTRQWKCFSCHWTSKALNNFVRTIKPHKRTESNIHSRNAKLKHKK